MSSVTKRLTIDQVRFLKSPDTLRIWSGMSLQQRCQLFHRRYPETKLSVYLLRKVYRMHMIRKKTIRKSKEPSLSSLEKIWSEAVMANQ